MTSVLLDTNAPQVGPVILAAETLMMACRELNDQVMISGEEKVFADAQVLAIALQAALEAAIRRNVPASRLFTAISTLNAVFVRHQLLLPHEEAIRRLGQGTQLALTIGESSRVYDLSAGGHA